MAYMHTTYSPQIAASSGWTRRRDDHPEALRRLKQLEAVDRMRERFTLAEALAALELGRSTCYERKRRLREEGAKGLVPRSSRPKSYPGRQWAGKATLVQTWPSGGRSTR